MSTSSSLFCQLSEVLCRIIIRFITVCSMREPPLYSFLMAVLFQVLVLVARIGLTFSDAESHSNERPTLPPSNIAIIWLLSGGFELALSHYNHTTDPQRLSVQNRSEFKARSHHVRRQFFLHCAMLACVTCHPDCHNGALNRSKLLHTRVCKIVRACVCCALYTLRDLCVAFVYGIQSLPCNLRARASS